MMELRLKNHSVYGFEALFHIESAVMESSLRNNVCMVFESENAIVESRLKSDSMSGI